MADKQSALLLRKQMVELQRNASESFSAGLVDDDIYKWEIIIMGPPSTYYEGGYFKARMDFPEAYPHKPPKLRFTSKMWHPNVHTNGSVCISILHDAGEDEFGYEQANERWTPVHTVESILISVISMLADPNDESPANIDAAKQWREDKEAFKKEVARCVRRSIEDL